MRCGWRCLRKSCKVFSSAGSTKKEAERTRPLQIETYREGYGFVGGGFEGGEADCCRDDWAPFMISLKSGCTGPAALPVLGCPGGTPPAGISPPGAGC